MHEAEGALMHNVYGVVVRSTEALQPLLELAKITSRRNVHDEHHVKEALDHSL